MPGPEYAGMVCFYEDFPYALWNDFRGLEGLRPNPFAGLPADVSLSPEFADITDGLETKIMGISLYESQIERLFDSTREMANAVRSHGRIDRRGRLGRRLRRTLLGLRPRLTRPPPERAARRGAPSTGPGSAPR